MNIQAMRIINNYETYIRRSLKGTASLYSMDIFEFGRVFGGGEASVLKYFQDHHLIRSGVECVPCGRPFSTIKKTGSVVGYQLRCPGCRKKESLAKDTFFSGAHLPLEKVLALLYFWSAETSIRQTTDHVGVSSATVVQWFQYFRDICSWKLCRMPLLLGGTDRVVQIDESVMVKAKYNRGRQLRAKQRWVFGIYDPVDKVGYIQLVEKRDADTLLPIIQQYVAPGTTIWSDEWAAYGKLSTLGYTHHTVNHSRYFRDPVTGMCTNHVEAYWCAVKRRFKSMCGTTNEMLPSYLDEHMWRERYGKTSKLAMLNMQRHIAERYPL